MRSGLVLVFLCVVRPDDRPALWQDLCREMDPGASTFPEYTEAETWAFGAEAMAASRRLWNASESWQVAASFVDHAIAASWARAQRMDLATVATRP